LIGWNRPAEKSDVIGADDPGTPPHTTHFDAIADAKIREAGTADENLRRAVDRPAEAVVLGEYGIHFDRDLSVAIIVGRKSDTLSPFVNVGNGPNHTAAYAFPDVGTRPPLSTRLSESGDADQKRNCENS
jgi:hypothetical protein